ncbi:MAG TPA: hypothetical protein PK028_07470 [Bacteroidales bacterium]|nr:hypothetical protein [Bacteroidales bacterium]MDI9573512.1 hypothetical protein [Bacteroidota bacterium]OQC59224.1 MAG: hypothetical protein BWX51_01651 [Bacteroidetes bacterium ADurb.Bin012]MBP9512423.1 hypothetical protein [Bacteroidales bacterium]MBP9588876.1 hypothetical protein [Bacteroidales bacterium]
MDKNSTHEIQQKFLFKRKHFVPMPGGRLAFLMAYSHALLVVSTRMIGDCFINMN